MEILIQIILVLALIKYVLKAVMTGQLWSIFLYAAFAAVIAFIGYPLVIEQPSNIIHVLLSQHAWVSDMAVITTIEATLGIFASIYLLDDYIRPKTRNRWWSYLMRVVPGLLCFLGIFFFELLFFQYQAGHSFLITAIQYSILLFFTLSILGLLIHFFLDEAALRLELKVILNLEILVIGLIIYCKVAQYNNSQAIVHINWLAMCGFLLLVGLGFLIGFILEKTSLISKLRNFFNRIKN